MFDRTLGHWIGDILQLLLNVALPVTDHEEPVLAGDLAQDGEDALHVSDGSLNRGLREVLEHGVHVEHRGVVGCPEEWHLGHVDWWQGDTEASPTIAHNQS